MKSSIPVFLISKVQLNTLRYQNLIFIRRVVILCHQIIFHLLFQNGFKLTKERSRWYPAHLRTRTTPMTNSPDQAETLQHSLERAAAGIGLYVKAHKTEYICFNQRGDISTLNGSSLKLVDKFTYLGSSVSSTETDINSQRPKAWTVIDWLSVICSYLYSRYWFVSEFNSAAWVQSR